MHLKDSAGISFCRHSAGISSCRHLQAVEGTCRNLLHCCRHLQQLTTHVVNLEIDVEVLKCWYIFADIDFFAAFIEDVNANAVAGSRCIVKERCRQE